MLQFYPESVAQADLLQSEALRAGFSGGLIVDYPNSTRAKKYVYLAVYSLAYYYYIHIDRTVHRTLIAANR